MSPFPRISVVIPCYNAERYVCTTLRSVFTQDWPELEVIVIDDGSTDRSVAKVADAFPEVILIEQQNSGVAAARNNGIGRATGELIAFVDADDYWLPGKLRAQCELMLAHPGARMVYGAWVVWECEDTEPDAALLASIGSQASRRERWAGPSGWIYPQLLLDCEVWTSTVLAHRSLFEEIGVFDPRLRIGEDYDLWLRASRVTEILRLELPTALYRQHISNITRKAPAENYQAKVIDTAVQRWGYKSPDGACANPSLVNRALARTWRNFASSNLIAGSGRLARHGALEALRLEPSHFGTWKMLLRSLMP